MPYVIVLYQLPHAGSFFTKMHIIPTMSHNISIDKRCVLHPYLNKKW